MIANKYWSKKNKIVYIFHFLIDIYRSNKIVELISFIIWELKYCLSLYDKNEIIQFLEKKPLLYLKDINSVYINLLNTKLYTCTNNWHIVFKCKSNILWGCLYEDKATLYRLSSKNELIKCFTFSNNLEGLFIDRSDNIFVCVQGILYKSINKGITFTRVLKLSTSKSYFRRDAITENPNGELFLGEYANIMVKNKWKFVGYIYHSSDHGNSWYKIDFLKKAGINKHVHILKWINLYKGLVLTEGDNKKGIWINNSKTQFNHISKLSNSGWKKVHKFHIQKGGYTGITEVGNSILFGTDYNGGTNYLISTEDMKKFNAKVIPNPYRRGTFQRIIVRKHANSNPEIWANIRFKSSDKIKSLIMLSVDFGKTWRKIIEYSGKRFKIDIISDSVRISKEHYVRIIDTTSNQSTTLVIT